MRNFKILIIIVSVIIVILTVSIFFIKNIEVTEKKYMATPEIEEEMPYEQKEIITKLEYSLLNKMTSTYIQALNIDEERYATVDENGNKIIPDTGLKKKLIDLLSKDYVERNGINENNVDKYVKLLDEQLLFTPLKMKGISVGNVKSYVVNGITMNFAYEFKQEINVIINIDYNNRTFSIEPTSNKYDEVNTVTQITRIEKNENNVYTNPSITIENITKDYMNKLKRIQLAKPELMYQYLNEDYRNKRFGDVEEFKKYTQNNLEEIKRISLNKYMVNTYNDYKEYVAKDQFGNIYVFKEKDSLEYTVELDDYTIENEDYAKEYKALDDEYKVANNINKWVKMINHRDYKTAYNVLDESFRNNYFKTQEEFEEYMKRYFPSHYEIEFKDFSKEAGSIYTMDVTFKDISNKENEFNRTIIMKLKDSTDFVMSMDVFTT